MKPALNDVEGYIGVVTPIDVLIRSLTTTTTATKTIVLLYGQPVTGKTTGARTFPNPYIVDFDGNLPAGVPNVIPLWDEKFVDKISPRIHSSRPPSRCAALLKIYNDLATHLPAGSTIITDSLTRLETWYNIEEEADPNKPRSSKDASKIDGHALFRRRLNYFDTIFTTLTACRANVVFIVHQQQDRNEKGDVTGQIKPSLMGQIGEKLPGYFPIVLQAVRKEDPAKPGAVSFLWRVRPSFYEPARVPKPVAVDFIPQQYSELEKYL